MDFLVETNLERRSCDNYRELAKVMPLSVRTIRRKCLSCVNLKYFDGCTVLTRALSAPAQDGNMDTKDQNRGGLDFLNKDAIDVFNTFHTGGYK